MGERCRKVVKTSISAIFAIFLYLNQYFNSKDNNISEIRMTSWLEPENFSLLTHVSLEIQIFETHEPAYVAWFRNLTETLKNRNSANI